MFSQKLVFARLCENGQGNKFTFRSTLPSVDVNYATSWNNFSHYSAYQDGESAKTPIEYNDISGDQGIDQNKNLFINCESEWSQNSVKYSETQFSKSIL